MILLVLILKHTQLVRTVDFQFDYIKVLYSAWNSVLKHSIHLLHLLSIGDFYSRDTWKGLFLTRENRKHKWNNL